jgi:uncharacterized membrane protein YuzA (DUF378 family)
MREVNIMMTIGVASNNLLNSIMGFSSSLTTWYYIYQKEVYER